MNPNSYTIESSNIGHDGGRYISKTPLAAAKKVATQLYKLIKTESKYKKYSGKSITFTIRKTTSGSNKKVYEYTAKQIKLAKPVEIEINGKKILYKNKIDVKKKKTSASLSKTVKKTSVSKSKTVNSNKSTKTTKTRKTKTQPFSMMGGCGPDSCAVPSS
jgi:hypothetical protein